MTSPHRSESLTHIRGISTSPFILLVPTGDGDSYEVVLGPIFTILEPEDVTREMSLCDPFSRASTVVGRWVRKKDTKIPPKQEFI
jgi:hypothetical protein